MLVYTPIVTPRISYIFTTLLQAVGCEKVIFTNDKDAFANHTGYKLNYSAEAVSANEFWLKPVGLLFNTGIEQQNIECFSVGGLQAFFPTGPALPFDIFAASFYLLSRYEEYLPYKKDEYGRFAHQNSLAWQQGFLNLPLINRWLILLKQKLQQQFGTLQLLPPKFKLIPTYDIDIAWSYKKKGFIRNAGGLLCSLIEAEWHRAIQRLNVLFGSETDPFDSYQFLHQQHKLHNLSPIYFFLVAAKNSVYDKNILPQSKGFQNLVKQHSNYKIGVHPSWQSGNNTRLIKEEKFTLERITGKPVVISRQHYIRMQLPDTYRQLLAANIKHDYSMGYGSINGFRASYCLPFLWYDLEREQVTDLTIHPFCFMDANAFYEQHLNCEQATAELQHYFQQVKEVDGELITIWHNQFLGTDPIFEGWREVYTQFLNFCGNHMADSH